MYTSKQFIQDFYSILNNPKSYHGDTPEAVNQLLLLDLPDHFKMPFLFNNIFIKKDGATGFELLGANIKKSRKLELYNIYKHWELTLEEADIKIAIKKLAI